MSALAVIALRVFLAWQTVGGKTTISGTVQVGAPASGPANIGILIGGVCQPFGTGAAWVQTSAPSDDATLGVVPGVGYYSGNETQGNCIR